MDHTRDPCPYVILSDFGGAFSMGVRLSLVPIVMFQYSSLLSNWPS